MKTIRHINLPEYLPQLKALLSDGHEIPMKVTGGSMSPFLLHDRDLIWLTAPADSRFAGEMVFYQRPDGQCVMHRIHHIDSAGMLFIIGDAQTEIEGPVPQETVFAVVRRVTRNGKPMRRGDFWWDFFEKVWIRIIPLRPLAKKIAGVIFR